MRFCKNCGKKINEEISHCENCGEEVSRVASLGTKKKVTKKQKVIFSAAVAALVTFGGLYYTGSTLADGERTLNNVRQAFIEEDSDALYNYMSSGDPVQEVTEQHAQDLINFYHNSPSVQDNIDDFLIARSNMLATGDNPLYAEETPEIELPWVSFEKQGSRFLLFDDYKLIVESIPMYILSNQDEVSFQVDGEDVSHEAQGEGYYYIGNFLPGKYEVSASLNNEFLDLSVSEEYNHINETDASELLFDVEEVEMAANVEQAELYIDGENSGITLSSSLSTVGPILINGEMDLHLEKESPFGVLSSEVKTSDGDYYDFVLQTNEDMEEQFLNEMESYFAKPGNYNHVYDVEELEFIEKIDIYMEMAKVNQISGEWSISVPVTEHWLRNVSWRDDEIDMRSSEINMHHHLVYNEEDTTWELTETFADYDTRDGDADTLTFEADEHLEEAIDQQEEDNLSSYMENADSYLNDFFNDFLNEGLDISSNSSVFDLIDDSAEEYEQSLLDYAEHLEDRSISRSLLDYSIEDYTTSDDEYYSVTTNEEYKITYGEEDETKLKEFESLYKLRLTEEGFKMVELEETNELNSEDY